MGGDGIKESMLSTEVLEEMVEIKKKVEDLSVYLEGQPCEGFDFSEGPLPNGWKCIDIGHARMSHMCLRCRILLYMRWPHGFPRSPSSA